MTTKQEGEKTLEEILQERIELRDVFILEAEQALYRPQRARAFQGAETFHEEITAIAQALEGGTA